ncbi:olfactory receptor class A-like protein 1 [Discoglossus pictus]
MDPINLLRAIGFLLLVILGIPGNVFILLQFTYIRIIEKKLLPTNTILMMLAFVNLVVVFSRVIPQSMNAIGIENLLDDIECMLILFSYRMSRGMSICATCLLSCYQCILIAPNTGLWSCLKQRVTRNLVVIIICLWILNFVFYSNVFVFVSARRNQTSPYVLRLVYCDTDYLNYIIYTALGSLASLIDFIFVGLMALASIHIVYTLICHQKSIKGIRSSDRGEKKSMEYKASRAIILLVALYVFFFGLDNCIWTYTMALKNQVSNMHDSRAFLACSYSALSPIVIIATNPKLQSNVKCSSRKKPLLQISKDDPGSKGQVYTLTTSIL